jgi:hypothetical protein
MHVTNLGRREMPDAVTSRFDLVVRQGTAGLEMKETERFQAERGLSPAAFIAGTAEEMKRIPERNPEPGFGGDSEEFAGAAGAADSRISSTSSPANARAAPAATRSRSTAMSAIRACSSPQSAASSTIRR